jgi:hypothetical protein
LTGAVGRGATDRSCHLLGCWTGPVSSENACDARRRERSLDRPAHVSAALRAGSRSSPARPPLYVSNRKREQAARNALKQILGRTPTETEVKALAAAPPPEPEAGHICSGCGGEMPWRRRLGAYWCHACSHAE